LVYSPSRSALHAGLVSRQRRRHRPSRGNIKLLHEKTRVNIFIFDYRGYGRSAGRASEEGTYLDGEAALDFARNPLGIDPAQTVLFGRSLGAAVAAEMATRFDSQALVLESPFASIRAMA